MAHVIDCEVQGTGGHQIAIVELDPEECVIAEAGAMIYMDEGIEFEARMGDGSTKGLRTLLSAVKRSLTNESIFLTHFTNKAFSKQRVGLAAPNMGEIILINLGKVQGDLLCQKSAFLAAAYGTTVSIAFTQKLGAGFFGGEGFILTKLVGDGNVLIHAGGSIIKKELRGEKLRVDTGCIVAMESGIDYRIEKAGGLKSMLFGGEGLFLATLSGHGTVWLQSMPVNRFAESLIPFLPQS